MLLINHMIKMVYIHSVDLDDSKLYVAMPYIG